VELPLCTRKHETFRCRNATANSSVAKFRCEIFAHFDVFAVRRHSSTQNLLFHLQVRIISEQSPLMLKTIMSMFLTLHFALRQNPTVSLILIMIYIKKDFK
jgi:hypothetical protein